ncbi:hypothetical protein G3435_01360 [Pseudomonas sp. MAFF212428]|uniref:Autotransporter outer membrane beta-barrel domain-containing protein n=1 Tax=Pseudomonas brassicae TaxID=2708063 RepID=A0A6M0CTD6_9PSED|nr:hypothetical protein [Pseudomonas brassicae]
MLGGTLNASGGQIRGEENGVWLLRESVTHPAVPQLQLDNTHVESGTGSAVRVTSASGASIVLSNGTTLTGGNGVILELGGGGASTVQVRRSDLVGRVQVAADSGAVLGFDRSSHTGDVIVAAGGTATLSLNNSSQLTGRLDNVQQVNINSNSNWTLNADNTVGNLAMNGGQVSFGDNARSIA